LVELVETQRQLLVELVETRPSERRQTLARR